MSEIVTNIEDMLLRQKKEIKELQDNCKHEDVSSWLPFMRAPGHISGQTKICGTCGKEMDRK